MDDRRLEIIIGQLLRAGVLLAAATVFAGGVLYLVQHHADTVNYRTFAAGTPSTRSVPGIVQSASHGQSEAIIQVGLLLLILTPVARVGIAIVGFFSRARSHVCSGQPDCAGDSAIQPDARDLTRCSDRARGDAAGQSPARDPCRPIWNCRPAAVSMPPRQTASFAALRLPSCCRLLQPRAPAPGDGW